MWEWFLFTERVSQVAYAVVVESSMSSYLGLHFKQLFSGTIRVSVASGFSFGGWCLPEFPGCAGGVQWLMWSLSHHSHWGNPEALLFFCEFRKSSPPNVAGLAVGGGIQFAAFLLNTFYPLVFTAILGAYLLWTFSWVRSVLVKWFGSKSDYDKTQTRCYFTANIDT